jgi:basic membrane protein A and related proteins
VLRPASAGVAVALLALSACTAPVGQATPPSTGRPESAAASPSSSALAPQPTSSPVPVDGCVIEWWPAAGTVPASARVVAALRSAGFAVESVRAGTPGEAVAGISDLVDRGCPVVVAVDQGVREFAEQAAVLHPYQPMSIVGDGAAADGTTGGGAGNVAWQALRPEQAAYVAGYLAAGMTASGVVGTAVEPGDTGGESVAAAFARGVELYDQDSGATVTVVDWDPSQFGDADVVLATTADAATSAAARAAASGPAGLRVIGFGSDGALTDPEHASSYLTSILTRPEVTTLDVVQAVQDGRFEAGVVVGDLANGAVGLAPFHDQEAAVPAELRGQVADLEARIMSGEVVLDG